MRSYQQYCPAARALDVVGERWTLLVVRELLVGPKRYTDLQDGLPGIGPGVLAARLRTLEEAGLVEKRRLAPPAASTVYSLTERGEGLARRSGRSRRASSRWRATPRRPSAVGCCSARRRRRRSRLARASAREPEPGPAHLAVASGREQAAVLLAGHSRRDVALDVDG